MSTENQEASPEETVNRHPTVEGLKINVLTVVGGMTLLASLFVSVGLYMSRMTSVESRIDLVERSRVEDRNTITTLKQDLAILETRVRRAEDSQQEGAKKLDKIASTVDAIGEMVLIMCQTSARSGVTCRLRRSD